MVSFRSQPPYSRGKIPRYRLNRRLGGPQCRSEISGKEIHQVPCREFEPLFACCSADSVVTIQITFLRPPKCVEISGNFMGMVNLLHCSCEYASVHWDQIAQYMIQHHANSNEDAGSITCPSLLDRPCYHHLTKHVFRGLYQFWVTSSFPTAKFIIQQQKR
jgi:hypothetical protein